MEPTVSPVTVRAIVEYARQRSIPIDVESHESRYPFTEVAELWSRIEKSDSLAGCHAAALVPFGAFGVVEHLMLLSETLDRSLQRLVRHYPRVNEAFFLTTRSARGGTMLELHARGDRPIPAAYADFVLTSIRKRMPIATGVARRPAGLLIHRPSMHARLPHADEELCEAIESVVSRRTTPRTIAQQVADLAISYATLDRVAGQLGMSPRTLQRRLIEEGTTFRAALDGARRQMATDLGRQRTPIKAIADRLGFADVRSFYRWRVRSLH